MQMACDLCYTAAPAIAAITSATAVISWWTYSSVLGTPSQTWSAANAAGIGC